MPSDPNAKQGHTWPVHPSDRFSAEDLGLDLAAVARYDRLTPVELNHVYGTAMQELLHGAPEGLDRVVALDVLHVLASKMGCEVWPVERKDG